MTLIVCARMPEGILSVSECFITKYMYIASVRCIEY